MKRYTQVQVEVSSAINRLIVAPFLKGHNFNIDPKVAEGMLLAYQQVESYMQGNTEEIRIGG